MLSTLPTEFTVVRKVVSGSTPGSKPKRRLGVIEILIFVTVVGRIVWMCC